MRGGRLILALDLLPSTSGATYSSLSSCTLFLREQRVPRSPCMGLWPTSRSSLTHFKPSSFPSFGFHLNFCTWSKPVVFEPLGSPAPGWSHTLSPRTYTSKPEGFGLSVSRPCCAAASPARASEMAPLKAEPAPVVLVHNDQLVETSQTAAEFLASSPRGAYTTARTVDRRSVFEFEFHVARLAQSVELMMAADSQSGAASQANLHVEITKAESLRPIMVKAFQVGVGAFGERYPQHAGELKITALLTWTNEGYSLDVHLSPLPPPPLPPVKVEIRGVSRTNAAAKDSEWVRQRKALEDSKPADVNEILLMGEQGEVLEGMSSNFFVVKNGAVQTAQEGVLLGTVREVALAACKRQGIAVELEAPTMAEAEAWEGAFISSTSRLVLPVDQLLIPGPQGPRVLQFEQPLVHNIAQWVKDDVAANSTRII